MITHAHDGAASSRVGRRLALALGCTLVIFAVEVVAGIASHSLAVLSDAAHVVTDVFALGLGWFAAVLAARPADARRTWGYHRAGIVAALLNAITLILLTIWILYQAFARLHHAEPVNPPIMIAAALFAILANSGIALFLREAHTHAHGEHDHEHSPGDTGDLNLRAAVLHVVGDIAASAGVVAGAIAIAITGRVEIDSAISVSIAVLLAYGAVRVGRDAISVLLESVPRGIDMLEVKRDLSSIDGVHNIHDLHVWSLTTSVRALSCHATISSSVPLQRMSAIRGEMQTVLHDRYAIDHATVQFEGCAQPAHRDGTDCAPDCICSADPSVSGLSAHSH